MFKFDPGSTSIHHATEVFVCLSDIHGNLPALKAVLDQCGPELLKKAKVLVAGDMLFSGRPEHAHEAIEVWRRLCQLDAICVRGLSDTALIQVDENKLVQLHTSDASTKVEAFVQTKRVLGELVLVQIKRLPLQRRIGLADGREIVLVHGSPLDPQHEMSVDMSDEELQGYLADDPASVVVCGSSHVAFDRQIDATRIINAGSVGASPSLHLAEYSVLLCGMGSTHVEQCVVEY